MKSNILKIIIGLVFLIAFNALFFLLGEKDRSTTEWLCYVFVQVAYLCLIMTPLFLFRNVGKGEAVLSASLYLRGLFYFFTELIIGVGFIWYNAYHPIDITWPAIIQSSLLALFIILQLMSVLTNDATKISLAKQRKERVYIRSLAENIKGAMQEVTDPTIRKQISNCYESLCESSLESFPEAIDAELELENAVNTLCSFIKQDNLSLLSQQIQKIQIAIKHRNQAIRIARFS